MSDTPTQQTPVFQQEEESVAQALQAELDAVTEQLQTAQDATLRAQADYQNLVRRTREERSQLIKMASKQLVSDILEPLEHLSMVAEKSADAVLPIVLGQLWNKLEENGLKEIECLGKPFDVMTMEVIDQKTEASEEDAVVVSVAKRGYTLNGDVIQHAKVVLGSKK